MQEFKLEESIPQISIESFSLSNFIMDSKINEVSNWYCDACGGNSSTGCVMSDVEDCVRR